MKSRMQKIRELRFANLTIKEVTDLIALKMQASNLWAIAKPHDETYELFIMQGLKDKPIGTFHVLKRILNEN